MTPYDPDKAALLLSAIGDSGYSLRAACGHPGVEISYRDLRLWADAYPDFRDQLEIAIDRRNYHMESAWFMAGHPAMRQVLQKAMAITNPEAWGEPQHTVPLLAPAAREARTVQFSPVSADRPQRVISLVSPDKEIKEG